MVNCYYEETMDISSDDHDELYQKIDLELNKKRKD